MQYNFEPWAMQAAMSEPEFSPEGETLRDRMERLSRRAQELTVAKRNERALLPGVPSMKAEHDKPYHGASRAAGVILGAHPRLTMALSAMAEATRDGDGPLSDNILNAISDLEKLGEACAKAVAMLRGEAPA